MKLKNVLFAIAIVLIAVWVISLLLKIAGWFIHAFVVVGGILLVVAIIRAYIDSKRKQS